VPKSPREILLQQLDEQEEAIQKAIGHFIYWFSRLEFTIKGRLANALKLDEDMFDIVIGPYDFVMLCNVTEQTISLGASQQTQKKIKAYFARCKKLNQEARLIVAHGTWTLGGARHVSRSTLKSAMHFAEPMELNKKADEAKRLMMMTYVPEDEFDEHPSQRR
jgi:hypothetical protein